MAGTSRSEEVRRPGASRSPCTIRFLQARVSCRLASRPPARFTAGQIASAHALAMRSGCASRVAAHPLAVAGATATAAASSAAAPDIHCCLRRYRGGMAPARRAFRGALAHRRPRVRCRGMHLGQSGRSVANMTLATARARGQERVYRRAEPRSLLRKRAEEIGTSVDRCSR